MTTPINVVADYNNGVYGIANYGVRKIIGITNPVNVVGIGPAHNVGLDLHPVPDYVLRHRMASLDGAINTPTLTTGVVKLDYTATSFNGVDQSRTVDETANRLIGIQGEFSVGCWVNPTVGSNSVLRHVMSYGTSSNGGTGFSVSIPINASYKARFISGAAGFNSSNDITPNAWNFILVTVSGTSRKIYLNGTVTNNTNTVNTFTATTLRIATSTLSTSAFFSGLIDDITYWKRALTASEEALLRAYRS